MEKVPEPNFVLVWKQCLSQDELCRKLEAKIENLEDGKASQAERNKLRAELEKAQMERCNLYQLLAKTEKPKAKKKEITGCVDNKGQN